MSYSIKNSRGFTLIEMLVSIALFAIVVTMALGALLALSVADRRAEATKSAMDNLTFALDSMSRAMRTGKNYHCGSGSPSTELDCNSGGQLVSFLNAAGTSVYYQFDTVNAHCGSGYTGCIERSADGVTWYPITSPDLVITNGSFTVVGAGATVQPTALIDIVGTVTISPTIQPVFRMQTAVTQRIYDL